MADPVIEWYESETAQDPLADWDYGVVDAGELSAVKEFYIYNDKGGGAGASTATDLRYTTFDDADGNEATDVVTQRWLEVQLVSVNGVAPDPADAFEAVGGSNNSNKKDWTAHEVASNAYLRVETRVRVPADPAAGARSFVQRLEYKFI